MATDAPPAVMDPPQPERANPLAPASQPIPARVSGFSVAFKPTPDARALNAPMPLARYNSLGQALNNSVRLLATPAGRTALSLLGAMVVDEWTTRPPLGPNRHINGGNLFRMSEFVDDFLTSIADECPYVVLGHTLDRHTLAYFHKAFSNVWDNSCPHFDSKCAGYLEYNYLVRVSSIKKYRDRSEQHAMATVEMDEAMRTHARGTNGHYQLCQNFQRYMFESMCAIIRQFGHMFVSYLALMQTRTWGEASTLARAPAHLAQQPAGNDGVDIPRDQAGAWLMEALFGGEVVHFRPQSRYHETIRPAKSYIRDSDGRYALINVFDVVESPEKFSGRSSPHFLLQAPRDLEQLPQTMEIITPERVFPAPYQSPQEVRAEMRERLCWMPRVDLTIH
ncbi:hypothetical protein B0T22DRAFT_521624 [Podospora appendiculata]|uniref:Uncharacterized protein n=1 Tax=Podospora appendiculata TaxID=314037 RepID=A0AAE0X148_9PEZI|nr:hypothetical protein B0T22DRAFT_521624 [Podospora appendiculata]